MTHPKRQKYQIARFSILIILAIFGICSITQCDSGNHAKTDGKEEDNEDAMVEWSTRGDSIAALMAAIDKQRYSVFGMNKDVKMDIDQPQHTYCILSNIGKDMISQERFTEVYSDFFNRADGHWIPETLKKNLWYVLLQLEIYRDWSSIKEKDNRFWHKLHHANYNCSVRKFKEETDKLNISNEDLESLMVIDIPHYAQSVDSILTLPEDAFKRYETKYGKWELGIDDFSASISSVSGSSSKLTIKLSSGKIIIGVNDLEEPPSDIVIEISSDCSYSSYSIKGKRDNSQFVISNPKEITKFLNSCINGDNLKFLFLYNGASHYGWQDYSLKGLDGAWSAYRAVN